VSQQIAKHLARVGGAFKGTELVTVMAGGNEVFLNVAGVQAAAGGGLAAAGAAAAAGWPAATQQAVAAGGAAAVQAAATAAVTAMGTTGAQLADLVKTQIIGKGAKYVVVVNLPDVVQTPALNGADATTKGLVGQMISTFNTQLANGLAGTPALQVNAFAQGQDQIAHPEQYALTNVTTPACSTTSAANPLQGSSVACTTNSTLAGVDVSHYLFADTVHLTPFGYQLLAQYVAIQMAKAGWI